MNLTYKAATYERHACANDLSADTQARVCDEAAKREGLEIVERFQDHGASGLNCERAGLKALQDAARDGRFSVLIVSDLARLSRSPSDLLVIVQELQQQGVRVFAVHDGFDSGKEHRIFRYLKCTKFVAEPRT